MPFIQVVIREDCTTASGASLRNRANLSALSTLRSGDPSGRVVSLRVDVRAKRLVPAPTVLPLVEEDLSCLIDACRDMAPDFVLIEGTHLLLAAEALHNALPTLPIVIDMHNVESVLRDEIDLQRMPAILRPSASVFLARRRRACRRAEQTAAGFASQIWVCSDQDRDRLRSIVGPVEVAVVANPIPHWAEHAPLRGSRPGSNDVLFVGHLAYPPNVQAADLLVREIMPRLRGLMPDARLHVCGRRPRRRLAAAVRSRGHRLTADPADLTEIYRSAAVTAIPLRSGGGTRLKVLEAMAVGCPIVATPKAVEGLKLTPGTHYLQADTAEEFASHLAGALRSPAKLAEMAAGSRQWVIDHFGERRRIDSVGQALAAWGI